jgi:glucose repression regulatory protein TUP1
MPYRWGCFPSAVMHSWQFCGECLVAGAEDKKVKVWDIVNQRAQHTLEGHELDIYSLDFSSNGRHVVSGSGDRKAKLWDISNGKCIRTFGNAENGPNDGVTSVAISPDANLVAAGPPIQGIRVRACE